jgi:hypothetical protein
MATVRPVAVVYADAAGTVEAFAVEVSAAARQATVSSVGWELQSDDGSASLVCGLGPSRHPQPRLPHQIPAGRAATWMMTLHEIREALAGNHFGITVDEHTAVLRAFAVVDGGRVSADSTVPLLPG